jgi:hypothetical protein
MDWVDGGWFGFVRTVILTRRLCFLRRDSQREFFGVTNNGQRFIRRYVVSWTLRAQANFVQYLRPTLEC